MGEGTHLVLTNTRWRGAFTGAALLACGCNGILGIEELTYDGGETSHVDSGMDATMSADAHGASDGGTEDSDASFTGGSDAETDACVGCPIPIVSNLIEPSNLVLDDVNVYFIEGINAIDSCPKTGCFSPHQISTSSEPGNLVTDGVNVYWSDSSQPATEAAVPGVIYSCPVSGCPLDSRQVLEAQDAYAQAMATDGTRLYWSSAEDTILSCSTSDGGTPIELAPDGATRTIATDGTNVYWASELVGTGNEISLFKCDVSGCGGKPSALLTFSAPASSSVSVATDGTNLYFVAEDEVEFCPVSGCVGGEPTILAKVPGSPTATAEFVATDGVSVYWNTSGGIMKCAVVGCAMAPTQIATVSGSVRGLAVDQTSVYWATENAIMKLTPK